METFNWINVPASENNHECYVVRNHTGIEVAFVVKDWKGYVVCRPNELYLDGTCFKSLEVVKQFVESYLNR